MESKGEGMSGEKRGEREGKSSEKKSGVVTGERRRREER